MENTNRGANKPPHKKHFNFSNCTKNTINSLNEVEYFLNNFKNLKRYIHLYKFFKK